jgi:hypothetical protein
LLFTFLSCIFQAICGAIDLDSDVDSYGASEAGDVQAMDFVKDLMVTPPMTRGKAEIESDAPATLSKGICPRCLIKLLRAMDQGYFEKG